MHNIRILFRIVHIGSAHIIRIPLNHVQHVLFSVLALQFIILDDIFIIFITALDKYLFLR